MTTTTGFMIFILTAFCIGEALAIAELWGRVFMLENFFYKGNKQRSEKQ